MCIRDSFNTKFSTYAHYIVYQQIRQVLYTSYEFKVNNNDLSLFWQINKTIEELKKAGKSSDIKSIATILNISPDRVKSFEGLATPPLSISSMPQQNGSSDFDIEQNELPDDLFDQYLAKVSQLKGLTIAQQNILAEFIMNGCDYTNLSDNLIEILTTLEITSNLPLFSI